MVNSVFGQPDFRLQRCLLVHLKSRFKLERILCSLLAIIVNSDLRHGPEFDCNQEASLSRAMRPPMDFNQSNIWRQLLVMVEFTSLVKNWVEYCGGLCNKNFLHCTVLNFQTNKYKAHY